MLETLPAELIAAIATHLPSESTAALSQTCRHCYYATLPVVYNYLCITEPEHLQRLAVRFQLNNVWSQRAEQFVHTISFTKDDKQLFSQMNLARFLGHTLSGVDYQEMTALAGDASSHEKSHENVYDFARRLFLMFPNVSCLELEADLIRDSLRSNDHDGFTFIRPHMKTGFNGSLRLLNYFPGDTAFLHAILTLFPFTRHLRLQARPLLSLCGDVHDSILTEHDILDLTQLDLHHLQHLELSYLDERTDLAAIEALLLCLPNLQSLQIEWVFPPSKDYFYALCRIMEHLSLLYPEPVERSNGSLTVRFTHMTVY